jgi:hypothetical protein
MVLEADRAIVSGWSANKKVTIGSTSGLFVIRRQYSDEAREPLGCLNVCRRMNFVNFISCAG